MSVPLQPVVVADGRLVRPAPRQRLLGEALLAAGKVDAVALESALARQRQLEAPLGRILLAEEAITSDDLHEALAAQAGLPLVDLDGLPPEPELLDDLDPAHCLALEAMPWRRIGTTLIVALSHAANARAVVDAFGGRGEARVAIVLAGSDQIRRAIRKRFADRLRDDARLRCPPRFSCRGLDATGGRVRGLAAFGAVAGVVALAPSLALTLTMAWVLAMNLMTTGLRLVALATRLQRGQAELSSGVTKLARFKRLPSISLLVPLRKEATVATSLVKSLSELDYPRALLDIKLILEEEDFATRAALEEYGLPACFEILTVPRDGALQTKPRALNFALPFCRGSIVGVYDAEDRPDPEQLRAVAHALGEAPADVACLQGYLDFYNQRDNWLARCFTIEYAIWFRVLLQGIQRLGIPIPLGGTTVFFRRRVLEEIGGWDAHNVTEDADLGMRLARFGYRCEMIRTVTLEEANCHAGPWIRQRARWLKGYAVTWLTHMRAPGRLWRDLGPKGFVGFQVLFLGGMTSYLSMPLLWALLLASVGLDLTIWSGVPPLLVWSFIAVSIVGQIAMLVIGATALADAGRRRMMPWLALLPLYWPLGAVAAYRAVAEIFLRPFHWHKTEHGLTRPSAAASLSLADDVSQPGPDALYRA